jgi:two-component system, chemotaxis family, chemotaxis protein CheY
MDPSSMSPVPAPAVPAARQPLRILYADDLHELRDVARISFSREGHGIECFEDGALALAKIAKDSAFDLVITDHHMPNMNGLEFVANLRDRGFPGKIMVFSSELSESVARQYREQKVDRILYKPVFPSMLRTILGELFPTPTNPA